MRKHYIRLKSYSTIGDSSWIEVFERGYENQIITSGNTYQQKILTLYEVHHLLNHEDIHNRNDIPNWMNNSSDERSIVISISQRLFSLHEALIDLRKRFDLKFKISIYLNSVLPVLDILYKFYTAKSQNDEILVNSAFSTRLIKSTLNINPNSLKIKPPIPEICTKEAPTFELINLKNKNNIQLGVFSRVIPGKLIHSVIETMPILGKKYQLTIYGFENPPTEYQMGLINMIKQLNLEDQIRCKEKINEYDERIKSLISIDICINLSITFEETLGKTLLEACYWGRTVITNEWNGFQDILPSKQMIKTYWNSKDWYHINPKELCESIKDIKEINCNKNTILFKEFFKDHNNKSLNKYSNKEIETQCIECVIKEPKVHLKNNYKKQEEIEKIFAPNLIKDRQIFRPNENHPWSILIQNQPKNPEATIIKKIKEWKIENQGSIHQSIANEIIEMLRNKIKSKNV